MASVFLQVSEVLTSGLPSRKCPPLWSHRHLARNILTSLPPLLPLTRPQTKKLGQAAGRRLTPLMPCSLIQLRRHPALTCPLHHHRHPPRTQTPMITTTPSLTCHCPHHLPPSLLLLPSRLLTAKKERSSNAGMKKRRLGWTRRGTVCLF